MESSRDQPAPSGRGPKRVLLLTPRLLDTSGGRACTDLALRLDRELVEPVVCCYAGWGPLAAELEQAGIEIFPLRRRAGLDPTFVWALAGEMKRRRIDAVHSLHARRAYVVGVMAGLMAKVPTGVVSFRDRPSSRSRLAAFVGRLCGELVGTVVATSDDVRQALLHSRWVPPGKTVVIPEGVNVERFREAGRRGPARRHWGVPEDAPVVGAVLEGDGQRELELVAAAFHELRATLPDARLLVCGLSGGDDYVRGLGAYSDGPAFYAAIDTLCLAHPSQAVPLSLLEGLAAGVPVAAVRRSRDAGRAPEGPWAFAALSDARPENLAASMLKLLDDPGAARALARGGASYVAERHSIDDWVTEMQGQYGG